jgi:hypothetical protein
MKLSKLQTYNLIGVLNDGFGGLFLILLASYLYPLLGFSFSGVYEYVVFGFVMTTGFLHYLAIRYTYAEQLMTFATAIIRFFISGIFLSLYLSHKLGIEALFIFSFDFLYAAIFIIWFYTPAYVRERSNV